MSYIKIKIKYIYIYIYIYICIYMMLVKNKPHKCELFNVSHHFIHKMCWLGGWPSKICVVKLNNFLTNCLDNSSSGWLDLNIFIPRFWVYNYGGWQGRWLTQAVIFKPPKWVYLNQIYKGFLWNLTNKWKLFIMSTFLGGWHLLKWVKKWLTLKCLVLWYILAKIVVITWTE